MKDERKVLKEIAEEISPKRRKIYEKVKGLSIVELYILSKRKDYFLPCQMMMIIGFIFYWPIQFFIKSMEMGNSVAVSYWVFVFAVAKVTIFTLILALSLLWAIKALDYFGRNYMGRALKIVGKVKRRE